MQQTRRAQHLGRATRQAVLELERARAHAVARQVEVGVQFSIGTRSISIQERGPAGWATIRTGELPPGVHVEACTAPEEVIRFTTRGTASRFGTTTLRGLGAERRAVIVNIAGRVRTDR